MFKNDEKTNHQTLTIYRNYNTENELIDNIAIRKSSRISEESYFKYFDDCARKFRLILW